MLATLSARLWTALAAIGAILAALGAVSIGCHVAAVVGRVMGGWLSSTSSPDATSRARNARCVLWRRDTIPFL